MGAKPEIIRAAIASTTQQSEAFEVWSEDWPTLEAFLLLERCWTWAFPAFGSAVRVGIPAQEIESTLRLLQIKRRERRQMFADIRAMEHAALEVFGSSE